MASIGSLVVNIGANTAALQAGLGKAQKLVSSFSSNTSRLVSRGVAVGAGVFAATGAASVGLLAMAANAERTAISLEVLMGSAEQSQSLIAGLRSMALQSPFNATDLIKSAETLSLFGVEAESLTGIISNLSEIAAGDAFKLERMTLAFAQMSAAGRLMGQDLLQMVNAGFNPLQEISRKTGESMEDLRARMENGAVSAAEVTDAFKSATAEGGRFFGMNDRMSKTALGQWQRFTEQLANTGRIIGEALLPTATRLLEWVNSFDDAMVNSGKLFTVVTSDMSLTFATMWETVRDYSKATFDWMVQSAVVMAKNIATSVTNVFAQLNVELRRLGEEAAFALGISDEIAKIPDAIGQGLLALPEFKSPALGKAGDELSQKIAAALSGGAADGSLMAGKSLPGVGPKGDDNAVTATASTARQQQAGALQRGSAEALQTILSAMGGGAQDNLQETNRILLLSLQQQAKEARETRREIRSAKTPVLAEFSS